MPWHTDTNGEKSYKPSLFAKEELPTWDELYKEFWLEKVFVYDPNDPTHQTPDLYWKRPHRKMLLSWVCNQLNKMVCEDKVITDLTDETTGLQMIRFIILEDGVDIRTSILKSTGITLTFTKAIPPVIYNCKIPSTGTYSIFTTNHPRIDIDEFKNKIELVGIYSEPGGAYQMPETDLISFINIVLEDVVKYFENGVGWKDHDGHLVPYKQITYCQGAGVDPAL